MDIKKLSKNIPYYCLLPS